MARSCAQEQNQRTEPGPGLAHEPRCTVPVGAGVHTGMVWMGAIGEGTHVELTAVGDAVNVTARLASAAVAGEILVTVDAATAAGLDPALERRSLALKGKQAPTDVISLRVGVRDAAAG